MRIYSMTATFGKLEHQTLTLEPGLNVIHAPNEWGKSTWCAFLVAMLYGIDTRERTTQTTLADKERYAPWSGSPMSGRMELHWNGKDITIERRTKGRSIFGDFKAYETDTGLPLPELTAANCGKLLLGVEKSVFTRAGFIRFSDLPVTEDESLRRRLNALVTTGDESSASDDLAQKLKDLKNSCRHNKTGALPTAENQRKALQDKLTQLQDLQAQTRRILQRQAEVKEQIRLLENHRDALAYEASKADAKRVEAARESCLQAQQEFIALKEECDSLPGAGTAQEQILQLEQLRLQQEALQSEILPPPPVKPETPNVFAGMTPEQALQQTKQDKEAYDGLCKPVSPALPILGVVCAIAAVALAFWRVLASLPAVVLGIIFLGLQLKNVKQQNQAREAIAARYPGLSSAQWIGAAEAYYEKMAAYAAQETSYSALASDLENRKAQLSANAEHFTCGASISDCLDGWRETLAAHNALEQANFRFQQAKAHADALAAMAKPAQPPAFEDTLTYSALETQQLLTRAAAEDHSLQLQQGQCMGQMNTLGQEDALKQQLDAVQRRIDRLEEIYNAVNLAQQTLLEAANDLQRKFAPRISQRAQALFAQLTGNRYDRLSLGEDLSLSAGREDEDTLRAGLWRSDGTVDQLYLALRLAVAEELTPAAPLVLDDALVRFDDTRLTLAMDILEDASHRKQVIVFSCQERETQALQK